MSCCNGTGRVDFAQAARAGYNPCCMVNAMPGIFRSYTRQLQGVLITPRNANRLNYEVKTFGSKYL